MANYPTTNHLISSFDVFLGCFPQGPCYGHAAVVLVDLSGAVDSHARQHSEDQQSEHLQGEWRAAWGNMFVIFDRNKNSLQKKRKKKNGNKRLEV